MTLKTLLDLKPNQKILLVGIGAEILQFLTWLVKVVKIEPKQIALADKKNITEIPGFELNDFYSNHFGENYLQAFENSEIKFIFKAPGIWSLSPEFENFRAKNGQESVLSSLVFFIDKFQSQIIGITGTKGKSTTSSLVQHFLKNSGYDSKYCGNTTGISPYQFWTKLDQEVQKKQKFVIELSSFQLQDLGYSKVSPDFAIITNYYIDHQDQHHGIHEYWGAKDQIYLNQNTNGLVIVTNSVLEKSTNLKTKTNKIIVDDNIIQNIDAQIEHNLLGKHNQSNLAQSLILVESLVSKTNDLPTILQNIESKKMDYSELLKSFQPLAHRIELVRTIELDNLTINFYDDGFATEPDAVAAAISSLTEKIEDYAWLILTGKDKGVNIDGLVNHIQKNLEAGKIFRIDYCGKIGQNINSKLGNAPIELTNFHQKTEEMIANFMQDLESFKHFIANKNLAGANLNIVLSPCGSSFDEFENYHIRSNWWVDQINSIKL